MSAVAYNDDKQLAFTQELRRQLVSQFMLDGKFPDDPKMLNILLGALKDYDKVTLTLKRLDSDNNIADADRQALAQFHALAGRLGSKDLARVDEPVNDSREGPSTPINEADLPPVQLVEGELERGLDPVNYDKFMEEQDRIHRQSLER
jgi:hypothetical protein